MQTVIDVEKVFSREVNTANGVKKVYDARTTDGQKYSAWEEVGAAVQAASPGQITVEYEERPNNGYVNFTIKKVISSQPGQTVNTGPKPAATAKNFRSDSSPEEQARINRAVAFKGAVDLVVAFGSAEGPFDALAQVGALTEDALLIVDASFVATEEKAFSLSDTE